VVLDLSWRVGVFGTFRGGMGPCCIPSSAVVGLIVDGVGMIGEGLVVDGQGLVVNGVSIGVAGF
jgi:hypothetical protein